MTCHLDECIHRHCGLDRKKGSCIKPGTVQANQMGYLDFVDLLLGDAVDNGTRNKPEFFVRRGASTSPAQPSDLREATLSNAPLSPEQGRGINRDLSR